jgi:UDP:flavonoid glycosyltransferase YjiC (YdhE family)
MLGGGVAADRRAQVKTVCAHLENRSDVMHVLVVWPTATTDPSWFQYKNTRVVQSVHASALIPLADLFISAIGYNSFHEVIYGGVPTIFIPQMASFMDDQRARGQAAADREVAMMVEPWEFLTLTKRIDECLDGHSEVLRKNLRSLHLPEPGARAAAAASLEVAQ